MDRYVHGAVLDMHMAREELIKALDDVGERDWQRYVPYGSRTLHELLAHVAAADQAWAVAAQGLLRGEGVDAPPLAPAEAKAARTRGIDRGRGRSVDDLREEMDRRRKLLLGLFELLEPRHLALALRSYGDEHNSVRERIWLGYHDRLHAADVRRALRLTWHPHELEYPDALRAAVDALAPEPTLYVIYNVDPVNWERPSPVPRWTFRELLAHIATGDWVFQGHLRHIIATGTVADWADIDAGNTERIHERRHSTDSALVEEYLSMRHETRLLIAQLTPQHLKHPISLWWMPEGERDRIIADYVLAFQRHDNHHRDQLRPAMKYARDGGAT
jgi:mycothiol maleylpyruvate isomerase-like protein/DinB family protein